MWIDHHSNEMRRLRIKHDDDEYDEKMMMMINMMRKPSEDTITFTNRSHPLLLLLLLALSSSPSSSSSFSCNITPLPHTTTLLRDDEGDEWEGGRWKEGDREIKSTKIDPESSHPHPIHISFIVYSPLPPSHLIHTVRSFLPQINHIKRMSR